MKANTVVHSTSDEAANQRAYAESQGWKGSKYQIWLRPTRDLYDMGPRLVRIDTGFVLPTILRISSTSDSSYSKLQWCKDVVEMWGDSCFFNSTIRAVKQRPKNLLEVFHKVVITTNGGRQQLWDYPQPQPGYTKANAEFYADMARGTMAPEAPRYMFGNFLEPATLTTIGKADQEHKVKFYRLRCLPTVIPRLETNRPVVHTVMRFNGVWNACEFARRYGMEMRFESSDGFRLAVVDNFGFEAKRVSGSSRHRVFMRLADRSKNACDCRDEWSELETVDSWMRVTDKRQMDHLPFVCDRSSGDCKACGLCATLDGTEPNDTNPVMLERGFAPVPFTSGYIEDPKGGPKRNPEDDIWPASSYDDLGALNGDFFADILEEAYFCPNPDANCVLAEQGEDWLARALAALSEYALSTAYFVESWNAHEHASTLLAYCFWALARKARRMGLSPYESWVAIEKFVLEATEGNTLLDGSSDLMLVFDGTGPVVDQFGTIDEPKPIL
jgi:hypothetical protein